MNDWVEEPRGMEQPERKEPESGAPESGRERPPGTDLNWLFVDMNSFFASVEQDARPELRGRPVGIVPMMADTTCCLAASYEAKACGVKTGTIVADAKRICPELVLVEARHELYVQYHHRIVEAVESCLPVTAVMSIDEMACRLMGRERPLLAAMALGRQVKARILERVGPMIRSSVGLATNRYLAKVASDMEKPDGLVALPVDILPEALHQLTLRALPGIGARTEKRLNDKGIRTMDDLLALDCEQAGELWGSVLGRAALALAAGRRLRHVGDGAPEVDEPPARAGAGDAHPGEGLGGGAQAAAQGGDAAARGEGCGPAASGWLSGLRCRAGEKTPVSRFGVPTRGWKGEMRLSECQDNQTLIAALRRLWEARPAGEEYEHPYFIGVHLNGLVPDRLHSLNLFDGTEDEQSRTRLLAAMDALNNKYGLSTLAPATMLTAFKAAPTRIAFHTIPELF